MIDELVEAVARAICEATSGPFEFLSELGRDSARDEARAAIAVVIERCAKVCEEQARDFLSPEYATGQPISSINERFACDECAAAIRKLGESE